MQRKWFVLLAGLVLFSLLIAPVGMVGAQGTPPPTPKAFQPFQPPSNPPFEMDGVGGSRSSLFPTVSGVNAPATSVGVSGFSFSYSKTIGTTGEPYLVDASNDTYLNGPRGIFVDAGGNLYVAENKGSRVQKFDSTGSLVLSLGHAGQAWHHDDFLSQPQDVAVRAGDGHIWTLSSPMLK